MLLVSFFCLDKTWIFLIILILFSSHRCFFYSIWIIFNTLNFLRKIGKSLGSGTFGKVRIGTHTITGEKVAIKILEKDRIKDKGDVERVTREINILKKVRHPNVIQLYEVCIFSPFYSEIMPVFWELKKVKPLS